jgi:hypothetical protein
VVSPDEAFQEPTARLQIASPEDTILQKLLWYRKGGGVSERQWNDILGVIKVQGNEWAKRSVIEDLLTQVFADSGAAGGG